MTVFRTRDATLVNKVVNKPEVRATFGIQIHDPAPIDFAEVASRDDYYILTNGSDAFAIFDQVSPSVLDGHSIFDMTCRGRKAITTGRAFLDWIWDNTPTQLVFGKTPIENRAARMFNRLVGFTSDGVSPFVSIDGTWDAEWFHFLRPLGRPNLGNKLPE